MEIIHKDKYNIIYNHNNKYINQLSSSSDSDDQDHTTSEQIQ